MKSHEAVRILMLSPFYFRLDLPTRKTLVVEFCATYDNASATSPLSGTGALSGGARIGRNADAR